MSKHIPKPELIDTVILVGSWACASIALAIACMFAGYGILRGLVWIYAQPWADPLRF